MFYEPINRTILRCFKGRMWPAGRALNRPGLKVGAGSQTQINSMPQETLKVLQIIKMVKINPKFQTKY